MRSFKKVISAVLVGVMAISFAACSGEVAKKDRKHKDRDSGEVAAVVGYKQYDEDEFIDIATEAWEKDKNKNGVVYSDPGYDEEWGVVRVRYNEDIKAEMFIYKDDASAAAAFEYTLDLINTDLEKHEFNGGIESDFNGNNGYIAINGKLKGTGTYFWSGKIQFSVEVLSGNTIVKIQTEGRDYQEKKVEIVNKLAEALDYPQLPTND